MLREVEPSKVELLRQQLVDADTSLPAKYRLLFSLRNIAGRGAHDAMLLGMLCMLTVSPSLSADTRALFHPGTVARAFRCMFLFFAALFFVLRYFFSFFLVIAF